MGIDLTGDGDTLVSYSQLSNWGQCSSWDNFTAAPFIARARTFTFDDNPCDHFQARNVKATMLSLYMLVAIEMFNSLNGHEPAEDASVGQPVAAPGHVGVIRAALPHPLRAVPSAGVWHRATQT